jgi:hypothetical protein
METKTNKKNPGRILGYLMAFAMVFFTLGASAQCEDVTVNLYDSYGDGGGQITVDGNVLTNAGFANSMVVCIDLSTCTDVIYASTDSWSYENSWDIVDASGAVIASGADASGNVGNCAPPPVLGCTDSTATNYNAAADTDDGSCTYPCLDDEVLYTAGSWSAENDFTITDCDGNILASMTAGAGFDQCLDLGSAYSVNLVDTYGDGWNGGTLSVNGVVYTLDGMADDGSAASWQVGACPVYGCTDATAANYDPAADTDDGSCTYGVPGCVDMTACNYDSSATADDGSCTYALAGYDCAGACLSGEEVTLTLTDSYGDTWNGGTLTINGMVYDQPTAVFGGASDSYVFCMDLSVCTDIIYTAGAYSSENSWSLSDNASGTVIASGGDNSGVVGTCVGGCTDMAAFNYDVAADFDDGSCVAVVSGCMDSTAANYDATANTDDGSCTYGVPGCTDMTACNYDTSATADDGSCTYAVAGYDCAGNCLSGEEVTLTLTDSWGDGGGSVTINGNTYTCTGSADVFVFCMDLSVCTDIIYASTDSWPYENGWSLSNANGVLASSDCAGVFGCIPESGIIGNTPGFDCAGNCLTGDLVTVTLYDSWGDGGGEITVDGNVLTNSGVSNSMTICLDLTTCTCYICFYRFMAF